MNSKQYFLWEFILILYNYYKLSIYNLGHHFVYLFKIDNDHDMFIKASIYKYRLFINSNIRRQRFPLKYDPDTLSYHK